MSTSAAPFVAAELVAACLSFFLSFSPCIRLQFPSIVGKCEISVTLQIKVTDGLPCLWEEGMGSIGRV